MSAYLGTHCIWVLVITDYATLYVETRALPSATARVVANFLLTGIILHHGARAVLLSNCGKQFLCDAPEELLRACNVMHKTTTAYHHQ